MICFVGRSRVVRDSLKHVTLCTFSGESSRILAINHAPAQHRSSTQPLFNQSWKTRKCRDSCSPKIISPNMEGRAFIGARKSCCLSALTEKDDGSLDQMSHGLSKLDCIRQWVHSNFTAVGERHQDKVWNHFAEETCVALELHRANFIWASLLPARRLSDSEWATGESPALTDPHRSGQLNAIPLPCAFNC